MPHGLTLEAQPIADQWVAKCSCGWRATASGYDFATAAEALHDLRKRHAEHVTQADTADALMRARGDAPLAPALTAAERAVVEQCREEGSPDWRMQDMLAIIDRLAPPAADGTEEGR